MDLSFTQDQENFRAKVHKWLLENIPDGWGTPTFKWPNDENEKGKILRDWDRKLFEGGFAGISWPKEYGGQGLSHVEEIIFNEEAGKLNAPSGLNVLGKLLLGPTLLLFGTEEQKKRFIPPLLRGDEVWCQGFSEPNAGSDLAGLQTRAILEGDEWVINGQKVWTSYAHHSEWCFVLARTNPDAPKHKGITFFLVPMDSKGVTVRPLVQLNKDKDFCEVFFENVRIPKENIVGDIDNGWKVAMGTLGFERGTQALGIQARIEREFYELVQLARELKTDDGQMIIDNAHYRQKFADIFSQIRIMRYHGLKTLSKLSNEGKLGPEASIQKLFWSTMHVQLGELAMDVLGESSPFWGNESVSHGKMQDIYFNSRGATIYAGSTQIQKNIISELILGMPK